jgi:hypothetical protein
MKLKALLKDLKKINPGLENDMYDLERDIDEEPRSYLRRLASKFHCPCRLYVSIFAPLKPLRVGG